MVKLGLQREKDTIFFLRSRVNWKTLISARGRRHEDEDLGWLKTEAVSFRWMGAKRENRIPGLRVFQYLPIAFFCLFKNTSLSLICAGVRYAHLILYLYFGLSALYFLLTLNITTIFFNVKIHQIILLFFSCIFQMQCLKFKHSYFYFSPSILPLHISIFGEYF